MAIQVSERFVAQIMGLQSEIKIEKDTDGFVSELRQLASDRLSTLSFPTTKDEDWKYTDVSALGSLTFTNQEAIASRNSDVEALIARNIAPESLGNCLVFVNGKYRKDLSDTSDVTEGLIIGTLATLGDRILPKLRSPFRFFLHYLNRCYCCCCVCGRKGGGINPTGGAIA